jgi:glycosyltransferase involved in cell wall biosynthesis
MARPTTAASAAPATAPARPHVCMHVLTAARGDVRVLREATALAEAGYAVTVVDLESGRTRPGTEWRQGVLLRHVFMPTSFARARFTRGTPLNAARMFLASLLHLLRTPATVYHAHDHAALPASALAALLRRVPLVYDAHELPLSETTISRWPWLLWLFDWLLALLLPRCAAVITVSQPIAATIAHRYHPRRLAVVRNIPPYQRVPRGDRLRHALGLVPEARIALFQGALVPPRLEPLVLAAAHLSPDDVIVLLGPIHASARADLEALIAGAGAGRRVLLAPPVPYDTLLEWTASADVGLLVYPPSLSLNVRYCLPNKLFEYLMAGLPVLATGLDAVAGILSTYGVGRIVSQPTPEAIGTALAAFLRDRDALNRMRQRALAAAHGDLCWEHERSQLIQLYAQILAAWGVVHTARQALASGE